MKSLTVMLTVVLGLSCHASAQQTPPPDAGPTLAATMQFLQEKLGSQGSIHFAQHEVNSPSGSKSDEDETEEVSNVKVNVPGCSLKYHNKSVEISSDPTYQYFVKGKLQKRGAPSDNSDWILDLKIVELIRVLPAGDYRAEGSSSKVNGIPQTLTITTDPAVFVLALRTSEKFKKTAFYFPDQVIADRVSKAMQHAVDLCKPPPPPVKDNTRKPNEIF